MSNHVNNHNTHHSSHFPSCLSPATSSSEAGRGPQQPPPATPAISGDPNLTTSIYHTEIGLFSLTWTRTFLGHSLHLQHNSHHGGAAVSLSPFSLSTSPSISIPSFHLHLKPFLFWNRTGSKKLHSTTNGVRVFWDLSRAKFGRGSGPEPNSGFYLAVVVGGIMVLLVGDSHREAYAKTRAKRGERASQALVSRTEHVFGNRVYRTKAKFGGKTREICIDCSVGEAPTLSFSVDRRRVLQIKQLKWKFRGNERIEVDGVPIQVSWDVYNWLFEDVINGRAMFMFRFEKLAFEQDDEEEEGLNQKNGMVLWSQPSWGFGINGLERKKIKKSLMKTSARSSSSSSLSSASSGCSSSVLEWASMEEKELSGPVGFSLMIYAWKG